MGYGWDGWGMGDDAEQKSLKKWFSEKDTTFDGLGAV